MCGVYLCRSGKFYGFRASGSGSSFQSLRLKLSNLELGYCPHTVTVYKATPYLHQKLIQLLLSGASTQPQILKSHTSVEAKLLCTTDDSAFLRIAWKCIHVVLDARIIVSTSIVMVRSTIILIHHACR